MNQYFKRQLKTPTCLGSFGIHPQGVLKRASLKLLETRRTRHTQGRSKFHAAKHRLRTQNISSNFSEARFDTP